MTLEPPVTFFSYAWTTEAHKARVRGLADRLRLDGVNVILDQTHLQPGDDTYVFMEQIANRADLKKVVVICDAGYKSKVDKREGGSGTEGSIMSPEVYRQFGEGPNKYVAVAFEVDERGAGFVPTMFASRLYIDMSTDALMDENYERLLRFLWDRPEPPVPIGKPPSFLFDADPTDVLVHGKARAVRMAVERGRSPLTPWQDFMDAVTGVFSRFSAPIDEHRHYDAAEAARQLEWTVPARDALADTIRLLVRENLLTSTMLVNLFTRLGHVAFEHDREWQLQSEVTAHTRAAVQELVLYVTAVLIQEDRPDLIAGTLNATYVMESRWQRMEAAVFGFIWQSTTWFAEGYARNSGRRLHDGTASWIQSRATLASLPFRQLVEADVILSVNSAQGVRDQNVMGGLNEMWYPVLWPFWQSTSFPLFKRLISASVLQQWLPVFHKTSILDLKEQGVEMFKLPGLPHVLGNVNPEYAFGVSGFGTRP